MTDRTVFAGIFLAVVAAAGLSKGVDAAWILAAITAALATIGEELRGLSVSRQIWKDRGGGQSVLSATPASLKWERAGNVAALLSWVSAACAGLSLLV